jgi:lipopolysaccharide export system permease protein
VWTTFDRYLFWRYAYVLAVFFVASMGLFTVVDGFMNLDAFQQNDEGTPIVLLRMLRYYLYQSSLIFDMVGPSLSVISVMVVLAITLKHNEFYPVLSTGVPTYRIAWPLFLGVFTVAALLFANQEFVIPSVAQHLQGEQGTTAADAQTFEPQYDTKTLIYVSGRELVPAKRQILNPTIVLPQEASVKGYEPELHGDYAAYIPASGGLPAVWKLKNVSPPFDLNKLTPQWRKIIRPHKNGQDLYLLLGMTFDQLQNRTAGFRYLSTRDLLHRIQHPSAHASSTRAQVMHLHGRFTRPIVSLISVFLVIPLILRREKDNLVANIFTCTLVLAVILGIGQGMEFLGQTALVKPEIAAWSPILFGGTLAGWLTGTVRT